MTSKIKEGYSWNRPNRRFVGQGLYLPGYDYTPRMGEIVLAVDTSGSLSSGDLFLQVNREPMAVHLRKCMESNFKQQH